MSSIQAGREVLSLFGIAKYPTVLNKKIASFGLFGSLISAFFVVLAISLVLGIATSALEKSTPAAEAVSLTEEKVAFTPGQFVSDKIRQGYMELR
ncbi:MAG: hypothetical protein WC675_04120 [Patescibacteria group bacterium]|jgi:hypothetical protein